METKNLIIIASLFISGCTVSKSNETGTTSPDFYSKGKLTSTAVFYPERGYEFYELDANNKIIRSEGMNDLLPVDSSSVYFRMMQRMKKFPEYRYREDKFLNMQKDKHHRSFVR